MTNPPNASSIPKAAPRCDALPTRSASKKASFDIRSNKAGPAVSGEITLHADMLWVQFSLGPFGPDREVCFRKVRDRQDHIGERNYWASVRELVEPDRFAERIRHHLKLPASVPAAPRLVA
jgi:hypothetical protein